MKLVNNHLHLESNKITDELHFLLDSKNVDEDIITRILWEYDFFYKIDYDLCCKDIFLNDGVRSVVLEDR